MGTVCFSVTKFLVVIISILFWLVGLPIVGIAVWMLVDPTFYISMAQDFNNYYISTYILLACGILLVIAGLFGCCGTFKESQCMLITFFCILLIILVSQIASAVWAYINADSLEPLVRSNMKATVQDEYASINNRRTSFDAIQSGLKCCGAESPNDWIGSKKVMMVISSDPLYFTIPESCCREGIDTNICKQSTHVLSGGLIDPKVIYSEGCIDKVVDVIKSNAIIFVSIWLAIMFIEVIGLLCLLILMVAINRSSRYKA